MNNIQPIIPPKFFNPKFNKVALIAIIIIFIWLTSCSSSKKIKTSSVIEEKGTVVATVDSSVTKKSDSTHVKKDNTVTTTETEGTYTKKTTKKYEPVPTGTKPEDYFPVLKEEIIEESGTTKNKKTEEKNTYDSTSVKKEYLIVTTKTIVVTTYKKAVLKNKEVKRTSYTGLIIWVVVGILLGIAGWYFGWWKWLFAFVRRKKEDQYPVKYTKYQPPKPPAK